MAHIPVKVKLKEFRIRQDNEPSADEPYIIPLFAKLDSRLIDPAVASADRHVVIHMPANAGHKDLGPLSKEMDRDGRNKVSIPAATGEWTTTLDTTYFDILPVAMTAACQVIIFVALMEEDSTLDSTAKEAIQAAKKDVQKQADAALQSLLGNPANLTGQINPDSLIDQDSIQDAAESVIPGVIGKALAKSLIPFAGPGFIIELIAQGDVDDRVGHGTESYNVCQLIGNGHRAIPFEIRAATVDEGDYAVTGEIRRTDSDEPPRIAAIAGPDGQIAVFARRTEADNPVFYLSKDDGKTWEIVSKWELRQGVLHSGVSAYSSNAGMQQVVASLGSDDEIWFGTSSDGGKKWADWRRVEERRKFKGTPAVTCSPNGKGLHMIARDEQDRLLYSFSLDSGLTFSPWRRIGDMTFTSSPATVVINADWEEATVKLPQVVVAALGTDNKIWRTRFPINTDPREVKWKALQVGAQSGPVYAFTSAPALALSEDGKQIVCAARGANYRYFTSWIFDDGVEIAQGTLWQPMGDPDTGRVRYKGPERERRGDLQRMYSSPALVLSGPTKSTRVFGLSTTLGLWRIRYAGMDKRLWRPLTAEPEPGFRSHYY
jgi:hypothetical protein